VKTSLRLVILGGLAAIALAAMPLVGRQALPLSVLADFGGTDPAAIIFWQIRVPRALAAFVGGAGLALGGAVFQAIFRNPLATPYTLGVASGASLGVALASRFGSFHYLGGGLCGSTVGGRRGVGSDPPAARALVDDVTARRCCHELLLFEPDSLYAVHRIAQ